jgi:ubiquinone/menaquinone biosynthesis C-methylase UbiE
MADDRYFLGSTPAELKRLRFQATILRPITERLLREAGVKEGMRVLDLGCGPGDVSFLAAEMVGPSGSVLGIDQAHEAVAAAKDGARHNGIKNVDFEVTTVEAFTSSVRFDAAVGRYVLFHQSDPTAFIRHVMRHIEPNGVIAMHEISPRHRFRSYPTVPEWDKTGDWLTAAFHPDNPGRDAATRLVEHFVTAGLPCPMLFTEIPTGGGEDSPLYAWTAETVRSVIAVLAASAIATEDEISIDTLEDRLRTSVVAAKAQVEWPAQICGWTKLRSKTLSLPKTPSVRVTTVAESLCVRKIRFYANLKPDGNFRRTTVTIRG